MKINRAFAFLVLASSLSLAFAAEPKLVKAKSISGKTIDALPNQVIVKYRSGRSASAKSRITKTFNTKTLHNIGPLEMEVLKVPKGESIDSFIKSLQDDPDVEFAEPNGIMHALAFPDGVTPPNDPSYNVQYYLGTTYLNMPAAWGVTTGSATTTVAVIDTGARLTHQDLSSQLWSGTGMTMEIDWDEDGVYITTNTCPLGPEQAPMQSPVDDNLNDCSGNTPIYHGTRVSGIIAASTNNGLNVAGVCPNCKIMAVKALNSKGVGPYSSVAEGIIYASTNGANVINMSLGSSGSDSSGAVQAAVSFALAQNIVVVAAAGNEGPCAVDFPASIAGVIAVGSINQAKALSSFSCTGSNLDLVAPGEGILSTIGTSNSATGSGDGTSFATPMVSGVAALVLSIRPTMSPTNVAKYIDTFSDDLGSSGFDNSYGYGTLNAYRTLVAVSSGVVIPSDRESPGKTYPKPNPFNPTLGTPVEFAIPANLGAEGLEIKIKNLAGETIKTLNGTSFWDGKNSDGNYVASGLYFYFVKTSVGNVTGKLTVLK